MRSCSRSAAGVCATVRAGFAAGGEVGDAVWKRPISPQPARLKAPHNSTDAAKPRRQHKIPRPRQRPLTALIRLCPAGLILAGHLNLPHPERFDPRPAARLDPAADPNSFVFEELKRDSRSLESRHYAP
jgi:hypothetical protein